VVTPDKRDRRAFEAIRSTCCGSVSFASAAPAAPGSLKPEMHVHVHESRISHLPCIEMTLALAGTVTAPAAPTCEMRSPSINTTAFWRPARHRWLQQCHPPGQ